MEKKTTSELSNLTIEILQRQIIDILDIITELAERIKKLEEKR